jgi:serine protease Do
MHEIAQALSAAIFVPAGLRSTTSGFPQLPTGANVTSTQRRTSPLFFEMIPNGPNGRRAAIVGIAVTSLGLAAAGLMLHPASAARPDPKFVKEAPRELSLQAVKPASELSDAFIAVSEAVTSAVVRIEAEQTGGQKRGSWFSRSLPEFLTAPADSTTSSLPEVSGGSGFIVSSNGYILTNYHVIEGADRITVSLSDKRTFTAQVIGADPSTDVAVIRIDAENLPAVSLGDSDSSRVGEWVLAIGNPGFDDASTLDFTVTSGIISAKGRPLNVLEDQTDAGNYSIEDFIQTDAVINPGNSGGPLVDIKGRVIGINTAIATTTGYNQGYGFAIPMNLAQRVMKDLIAHGYVRRALLGVSITEISPEDAEVYHLPKIAGVLVEDYDANSPAHSAGLNRSDVIVAVDGAAVESVGGLQRLVALHQPGEFVNLSIIRYGARQTVRVKLAEAPNNAVTPTGPPAPVPGGLGIEVIDLDARLARELGFSDASGVIISKVAPGSAAYRKEVGEGHRLQSINQQRVQNSRDARRLLHSVKSGQIASLVMETGEGRTYIANVRVP